MDSDALLSNLNPSQQAAVSSTADTLAILAGPGSGKTHTLTSRTAWLLSQGLQPWNIIVATFTVKAAREMKERIGKLIGNGLESKLVLGTFHSISRRYIARYGHLIGIKKDFGIADTSDSAAIIKRICKRNNYFMDPKVARSRISGRKARGGVSDVPEKSKSGAKSVEAHEFDAIHTEYEEALKVSNLLDYDDLLLRCVELLRDHPDCVSNVEAVLIDEFQDTNLVQFDLMRLFAAQRKRITIVGDPDQSIYGFRAAEIKNYKRMLRQYPDTITIALEENYRSSASILMSALSVIEQDEARVKKSLMPTHLVGTRPVLRRLAGAYKEAEWIVTEIQRCQGMTGGLLDLNDYAILLRSSALSRLIETALGKAGIAYKMVGGLRFYDRMEIKTILDYLRVINQPDNNDALARIINTPSRRIGDATIKSLLEEADRKKVTLWSLVLGAVRGRQIAAVKLQKQAEQALSKFVNIILSAQEKLKSAAKDSSSIVELIGFVLEKTNYENWLEEHHNDVTKARWDNVKELITQATDFQGLIIEGNEDEALPNIVGLEQQDDDNPLSRFLSNVALASEVKNDEEEGTRTAQITISTIHAAKGLEWPVVFIPAAYEGSIPHSRADDIDEERRLLYVAMTRSKALLYMSVPLKNSQSEATTLCPFLTSSSLNILLQKRGPALGPSVVQSMSQILRRTSPTSRAIAESSSFLKSIEDDLFSENGEDSSEKNSRWSLEMSTKGSSNWATGQQASKRRRVELGRSNSDMAAVSEQNWKPNYTTTMARASTFTATTMPSNSGFVSAGSHLQVLNEQSVNAQVEEKENINAKQKPVPKGKAKKLEGQGNLMAFLGKPEPKDTIVTTKTFSTQGISTASAQIPLSASQFSRPRISTTSNSGHGIAPDLASHHLGSSRTENRPRTKVINTESRPRNDYVFLSSSPPRPLAPIIPSSPPQKEPAMATNTSLMPLIRPATTMHTTSMAKVQSSVAVKKTLGVKRSMDGWSNRASKGFKPPLRKS